MEDAVDYYNAISGSYENLYREEQIKKIKYILRWIDLDKIKTILDIGAGTGILEEFLTDKDVTAVEPSNLFKEITKKGLKNIRVINSRIEDMNFTEKFDLVICLTMLQDLGKKEREDCLEKVFRFTKADGMTVISILEASNIDLSDLKPTIVKRTENDVIFFFGKM